MTFGLEEKASDVFSRFISFHNLDDRGFNESDWQNESGDEAKRFLSHLESIGISPGSIFNLIQSPDYLQVQKTSIVLFLKLLKQKVARHCLVQSDKE